MGDIVSSPPEIHVDAILFDCDGTLVDSEELAIGLLVEMAAEHGAHMTAADALEQFRGTQLSDCVTHFEALLGSNLPAAFVSDYRTRMTARFREELQPIEGALELVQALELPMCIASNGPREKVELSLSLTGLLPFFRDHIYSSYDVGVWKPAPDLFLHAASSMGVDPQRCAVVEDSMPGIEAGLAAGMTVYAFQPHERDPAIPAGVTIVTRLADLLPLLSPDRVVSE